MTEPVEFERFASGQALNEGAELVNERFSKKTLGFRQGLVRTKQQPEQPHPLV